ncbi:hypothetical protein B0H13DRAFT_1867167 [Mycena leptocephala]|nr:hypothetical protein B0H13DRAFT_1867167 [Mycena leptocephala]
MTVSSSAERFNLRVIISLRTIKPDTPTAEAYSDSVHRGLTKLSLLLLLNGTGRTIEVWGRRMITCCTKIPSTQCCPNFIWLWRDSAKDLTGSPVPWIGVAEGIRRNLSDLWLEYDLNLIRLRPVPPWECAAVKDCGDPATHFHFFFFLNEGRTKKPAPDVERSSPSFLIPPQFTAALERRKWFVSLSATRMLQDSLSTVRRVTLRNGAALLWEEEQTQWRIAIEM